MEYCVQAWGPYLHKDITLLERIQRMVMKLVKRARNVALSTSIDYTT